MHGTSSVSALNMGVPAMEANNYQVIDAMQPWKNESQFTDFIAEQSTFPTEQPSPNPNAKKLSQPQRRDLEALAEAYARLQRVEHHLKSNGEDTKAINQLMNFVRGIRKVSPNHSAAQRFEMLNPLRGWLFWLPVSFLQQSRASPSALVILAHYYTVALVVEPLFPEIGAAYFGSLTLGPIEEIARRIFSINVAQPAEAGKSPLGLMEYPIDMVAKFRQRMGWVQPERTASFPTFDNRSNDYDVGIPRSDSGLYNYPSFSYSQESLMTLPSEPASAVSPMMLSDPYGQGRYLGVPSPGAYGGYHSPVSSTLGPGEGSVMWESGPEYMYEGQNQGHGYSQGHPGGSGMAHGGFVPPTVWI